MKPGDILEFRRAMGLFYHYAMYIGENKVIHRDKGPGVTVTELDEMVGEMRVTSPRVNRVPTEQALARAFELTCDKEYNPITHNCEHFVNGVRYSRVQSRQVRNRVCVLGFVTFLLLSGHRFSQK
jgi:hypothetical protein